jgi:methyl-accepting chemotaxis protein
MWAFTMAGFGQVIALPHNDIDDLNRIIRAIQVSSANTVSAGLAAQIKPDMDRVIDNSTRFGPLVAEAVAFVKVAALAINLGCLALVLWIFLVIRSATLAPLKMAVERAQRVAQGDLCGDGDTHGHDEVGELHLALSEMSRQLAGVVGDVRELSGVVAASMVEVSTASVDLSARTEHQAATLQQTSASVSQLSDSVRQNGERVRHVNEVASDACQIASAGGEAVTRVVNRMDEILGASRRIADITGVIDGIAFQTNILALNAAVEAARAGEQGKGFAVVASEVRTLAQRSAGAAKEIASLISDTLDKVAQGAKEVNQAGTTITQVVASVRNVSSVIGEVATGLSSQESGIAQIDQAMRNLDENTQQNAAMAEESASAATSVRAHSDALLTKVQHFKVSPTV